MMQTDIFQSYLWNRISILIASIKKHFKQVYKDVGVAAFKQGGWMARTGSMRSWLPTPF